MARCVRYQKETTQALRLTAVPLRNDYSEMLISFYSFFPWRQGLTLKPSPVHVSSVLKKNNTPLLFSTPNGVWRTVNYAFLNKGGWVDPGPRVVDGGGDQHRSNLPPCPPPRPHPVRLGVEATVLIPILSLSACVTLSKSLYQSKPQFLHVRLT